MLAVQASPIITTLPALDHCEVVIGQFRQFARHSHEGLMLSIIEQGEQQVDYRGSRYRAGAGSVVAVAPEEAHACSASREWGSWLFQSLVIPKALARRLLASELSFHCETAIGDAGLALGLRRFFHGLGQETTLAQEALLYDLLSHFLTRYTRCRLRPAKQGREQKAVGKARDFLAAHSHCNVGLQQLAEVADCDGYRLNRAFSQTYGLPPHAWHKQYRLRQAARALVAGERIADVALAYGFADQAHFSRAFKQLHGLTPARFAAVRQRVDQQQLPA
ncbi:AraC family transcriptional regulator [Halioxenophilus sp. WMMB6]|uniref:helix-turn-helix transcriptional regulator n=1 Tax=Halioxenophilus sp. WMMB6 TaxID=3073815 RepID=UPI00295F35BD|nr:AraC family transcriptional regulator [Halioxenophilus sp. WMMB6]